MRRRGLNLTTSTFCIWSAVGSPAGEKPRVLEFPAELMKEEQPQGSFHIQEERRLFYVAVTRARHRLTLNTVENKRSKPISVSG